MGILGKWFGRDVPSPEETFLKMRDLALNARPQDLGLRPTDETPVYGVIMETGFPEGVASFVCMGDGAVSLYTSGGGGVIGAGQHENVRNACLEMLSITNRYSADFFKASLRTTTYPKPGDGQVFFYLLTTNGVYSAQCREENLAQQRDPFSALFNNCHAVMTEAREVSENRGG